ncbi:MAG: hypothetical protein HKL90_06195 [Elusimicrobia bacterium]|nr:hypothetical protein [Elusimicrobiota bacterium]
MTLQAQLASEMKTLPPENVREVLNFVRFLRLRRSIDTAQAYFWTRHWQANEKAVEQDKRRGRVRGNGTMRDMVKVLGR